MQIVKKLKFNLESKLKPVNLKTAQMKTIKL